MITTTPRNHWLREPDLNQRPLGYEPNELPDCSIPRYFKIGGGKGIRTPAPISRPPGFQDRSLQPDLGIPPKLGASGRSRTGTGFNTRRILSPVRLPIPPLRQQNGDPLEIRTPDPLIKSQMLYRLS